MRKRVFIAVAVLGVVAVSAVSWMLLGLPPPRLVLKYGLPPAGGPTGRRLTVEGIEFIELGPGYFQEGSHRNCFEGDLPGRISERLGLPWGEHPVHGAKECPPHWEEISFAFWIARTELTVVQFAGFDPAHRQWPSPQPDCPVKPASWEVMLDFCEWLSGRSGSTIRPPTGNEWEYACRAGSPHAYPWGEEPGRLAEFAWYSENGGGQSHPVGTLRPNKWGLYDMLGNVDERVSTDRLAWLDEGASEQLGVSVFTSSRVVGKTARGGFHHLSPTACRCGFRVWRSPAGGGGGFRPAATFRE